jgi:hypothetical protein
MGSIPIRGAAGCRNLKNRGGQPLFSDFSFGAYFTIAYHKIAIFELNFFLAAYVLTTKRLGRTLKFLPGVALASFCPFKITPKNFKFFGKNP